jgi:hypothetical protein
VIAQVILMEAFPDNFASAQNDAAHRGVRARDADAFSRQGKGVLHTAKIMNGGCVRHERAKDEIKRQGSNGAMMNRRERRDFV